MHSFNLEVFEISAPDILQLLNHSSLLDGWMDGWKMERREEFQEAGHADMKVTV